MKANIVYSTDQIARQYTRSRIAWRQFYESEWVVIGQLKLDHRHAILDAGRGCGGLGMALRDQFGAENYTGVKINVSAAESGWVVNPKAKILCGDWDVRFFDMLAAVWIHVFPGGHLVATFRLMVEDGCSDFERSYQYINYDGVLEGERASYVVLNAKTLMEQLASFNPSGVKASGYWGIPSTTAVTPYERLCFAAFSIQKRKSDDVCALRCQLDLPAEILNALELLP